MLSWTAWVSGDRREVEIRGRVGSDMGEFVSNCTPSPHSLASDAMTSQANLVVN